MNIYAKDQNGNKQDGVYSYPTSLTDSPSNILRIHLDDDTPAFGVVRNVTAQKATIVMRNATQIRNKCRKNYNNTDTFQFKFSLSLTDSSKGMVVSYHMYFFIIITREKKNACMCHYSHSCRLV